MPAEDAVKLAAALTLAKPVLLGDAAAVIAQARGVVRCPPSCVGHLSVFRAIEREIGQPHLRYVKRQQNLAGIQLAAARNRADARSSPR